MKEKSNENHLPKAVGIHEHLLKKEAGVKVIPLDSSNGKWDFQSARILKMSTSIRHKVHSKKRTVRMDIVCKTPLPILATVLYDDLNGEFCSLTDSRRNDDLGDDGGGVVDHDLTGRS